MKTVLCVPGHDEKKVERCREWGADLILFDLEDSVPEEKKARAREIVVAHVKDGDHVRVNGSGMEFIRDIDAIDNLWPVERIWVPKMKGPFHGWNGWPHHAKYVLIVETPMCVASGLQTLLRWKSGYNNKMHGFGGLAFGAADFAAYMGVPDDSQQVAYARQQVALAAKALCVDAYDSPFLNMRPDGYGQFRDDIYCAHQLGYGWKGVVHPAQIDVVKNDAWKSLYMDRQLVDRYERERGEDAVAIIDGRLVAPPHIRAARQRLEESKR